MSERRIVPDPPPGVDPRHGVGRLTAEREGELALRARSERPMAASHSWNLPPGAFQAVGQPREVRADGRLLTGNASWDEAVAELLRVVAERDLLGAVVQRFFADHKRLTHAPGAYCRCEHWAKTREALSAAGLLSEEEA